MISSIHPLNVPIIPTFLLVYREIPDPLNMDIKISQQTLLKALQLTAPAANPNPSFPMSQNSLLTATKHGLTVSTHDGTVMINNTVPLIEVTEPGKVFVEHKLLYNWTARTKSNTTITLSTNEDQKLHCKAARSHVKLGVLNPNDAIPNQFKSQKKWTVPTQTVKQGLATTSNSRIGLPEKSDGDSSTYANGTHLRITPNYITIEAVSHTYGAFYHIEHESKDSLNVIIPPKISGILQTTLPDTDDNTTIEINEQESMLKIQYDNTEWYTVLIASQFPDTSFFYENLKPIYSVNLDSTDFRNAIHTAEMFMENSTDAILLWIEEDDDAYLNLKSEGNEKGSYEGQLSISDYHLTADSDPLKIAGSIAQLSKISNILRSSEQIEITVKCEENNRIHLKGDKTPHTFYITMPIKLQRTNFE